MTSTQARRAGHLLAIVALGLVAAGCGWELPGVGRAPGGGNGADPGAPNGNGGVVGPGPVVIDPAPGNGGGGDPGDPGRPSIEEPVPGQLNPVPVSVWRIEPAIDGRHVRVLLSWWSGPAPCSVLDSVEVVRDGTTITMTPLEGVDPAAGDVLLACPAIAMYRGTIVDLGELEPGTWTLAAPGGLAPVQITVE